MAFSHLNSVVTSCPGVTRCLAAPLPQLPPERQFCDDERTGGLCRRRVGFLSRMSSTSGCGP